MGFATINSKKKEVCSKMDDHPYTVYQTFQMKKIKLGDIDDSLI